LALAAIDATRTVTYFAAPLIRLTNRMVKWANIDDLPETY
jgi:hypothetical protein